MDGWRKVVQMSENVKKQKIKESELNEFGNYY